MRMLMIAAMAATCWGCGAPGSGASRAERPPNARPVIPDTVEIDDLGVTVRVPRGEWVRSWYVASRTLVLESGPRRTRVTIRAVDARDRSFSDVVDAERRAARDRGAHLGQFRFSMDYHGQYARGPARRSGDIDTQDGILAVLRFNGRDTAIVVSAWWSESPIMSAEVPVREIIDGITPR